MKLFASTCILVLFNVYFVDGNLLSFANFFRSNNYKTSISATTSTPSVQSLAVQSPESEQRSEEEDSSESFEYKTETDSYLYNSSSEQEFMNSSDSWNSTASRDAVIQSDVSSNASNAASVLTEDSSELDSTESHLKSGERNTSGESATEDGQTASSKESTTVIVSTEPGQISSGNSTTNEQEEVILGTKETSTVPVPKSFIQQTLDWVEDEYTLSILIPITAGIIFALTIIITIATCRCIQRCCRRRRFRKKILPDSVKTLRPSDRARLLGDFNSSDDEF